MLCHAISIQVYLKLLFISFPSSITLLCVLCCFFLMSNLIFPRTFYLCLWSMATSRYNNVSTALEMALKFYLFSIECHVVLFFLFYFCFFVWYSIHLRRPHLFVSVCLRLSNQLTTEHYDSIIPWKKTKKGKQTRNQSVPLNGLETLCSSFENQIKIIRFLIMTRKTDNIGRNISEKK